MAYRLWRRSYIRPDYNAASRSGQLERPPGFVVEAVALGLFVVIGAFALVATATDQREKSHSLTVFSKPEAKSLAKAEQTKGRRVRPSVTRVSSR